MENRLPSRIVLAALVLAVGCAPKMTIQQALVEEAFEVCRAQGRSAELDRVDRDGTFSVVGRESDAKRVHECMVRYAEGSRRPAPPGGVVPPPTMVAPAAAAPAPPASTTPAVAAMTPPASGLMASRLPGTWRGTLKLPPRGAGEAEIASPATLSFVVAAGALRWTLAATVPGLAADGTAVVVDGELRMTGTVRNAGARSSSTAASRGGATVRYAGTMVGDRLEVTGVTTDKQVHVLSIRRVGE